MRKFNWFFVVKVAGACVYVYVSIDTHFVAYCSDSFAIETNVGKSVAVRAVRSCAESRQMMSSITKLSVLQIMQMFVCCRSTTRMALPYFLTTTYMLCIFRTFSYQSNNANT